MSVPKRHKTKSRVRQRRSHLSLKRKGIVVDPETGAPTLPHRALPGRAKYSNKKKK